PLHERVDAVRLPVPPAQAFARGPERLPARARREDGHAGHRVARDYPQDAVLAKAAVVDVRGEPVAVLLVDVAVHRVVLLLRLCAARFRSWGRATGRRSKRTAAGKGRSETSVEISRTWRRHLLGGGELPFVANRSISSISLLLQAVAGSRIRESLPSSPPSPRAAGRGWCAGRAGRRLSMLKGS